MRSFFNRLFDLSRMFSRRWFFFKCLKGDLTSFGIGAAIAVVFGSLCLTPVASYAAEANEHRASLERAAPVALWCAGLGVGAGGEHRSR